MPFAPISRFRNSSAWLLLAVLSAASAALAQNPDYEALGRGLVTQLSARQFDKVEAQFDDQMKAALPVAKMPEVWDSILAQVGAFKGIAAAKVLQKQGLAAAFVTCEFERATLDAQIYMDSRGQVKGLFFAPPAASDSSTAEAEWKAPAYADAGKFHERDTTITSGRWQLPGVLTLPATKLAVPAVVLVQGSGPHDQDETLGPAKPFKDLAWGLATQNIAVLRYVKRTKQYGADSKGDDPFTVKDEVTDDAIAAVALLAKKMPEINKKQIYVLGHSLGGMLAPRIAAQDSQVAGIIIMAGNERPLEKLVIDQIKYIASLTAASTPENQKQIDRAEAIAAQVESPALKRTDTVDFFGSPIPGSYFLDLRTYDPAKTAAGLKVPILILQGGRDYQVTAADFDIWKKELVNDPRVTFKFYPTYTHLFNPGAGSGPPSPQDYDVPSNVSEDVITDIAKWIKANAAAH